MALFITQPPKLFFFRMCRFPASGSSWESLAQGSVSMDHPGAPVRPPPDALPSAGRPDRPSIHYLERGSPMRNRKREICTSGSARDEDGQPPHLLGRRRFVHLAMAAAALPALS